MYPRTYVSTYLRTYVPTYLRTYVPTYLPIHPPTYQYTYVPAYLHTFISTYLFVHAARRRLPGGSAEGGAGANLPMARGCWTFYGVLSNKHVDCWWLPPKVRDNMRCFFFQQPWFMENWWMIYGWFIDWMNWWIIYAGIRNDFLIYGWLGGLRLVDGQWISGWFISHDWRFLLLLG